MRVKSVELINLKSYERTEIEFSRSVNILVGANNSGKSTIIRSLMNLQYKSLDVQDIRATKSSCKIFTKLIEIDEIDASSFYDPAYENEFEPSDKFEVFWHLTSDAKKTEEYTNWRKCCATDLRVVHLCLN